MEVHAASGSAEGSSGAGGLGDSGAGGLGGWGLGLLAKLAGHWQRAGRGQEGTAWQGAGSHTAGTGQTHPNIGGYCKHTPKLACFLNQPCLEGTNCTREGPRASLSFLPLHSSHSRHMTALAWNSRAGFLSGLLKHQHTVANKQLSHSTDPHTLTHPHTHTRSATDTTSLCYSQLLRHLFVPSICLSVWCYSTNTDSTAPGQSLDRHPHSNTHKHVSIVFVHVLLFFSDTINHRST